MMDDPESKDRRPFSASCVELSRSSNGLFIRADKKPGEKDHPSPRTSISETELALETYPSILKMARSSTVRCDQDNENGPLRLWPAKIKENGDRKSVRKREHEKREKERVETGEERRGEALLGRRGNRYRDDGYPEESRFIKTKKGGEMQVSFGEFFVIKVFFSSIPSLLFVCPFLPLLSFYLSVLFIFFYVGKAEKEKRFVVQFFPIF